MGEKGDFLQVVTIPYPKNRFLVTLRSFFSTYKLFSGREWLFRVSVFKEEKFNEKMSSLAGLKKTVIQFPAKVPILAISGYLGPHSKPIFSTYRQKFETALEHLLGEVVRNIVLYFELYLFGTAAGGRGARRFASRHFPNSLILPCSNFVGQPFVACYACSIVYSQSST